MFDALPRRFYVPVHHRRRGRQAEAVRGAHDVEPLVGVRFAGRDSPPHPVVEDFGSGSGQRVESRVDQPSQRRFRVQPADPGDVEYFGRAERMQSDLRIARFQLPEQVFVKIDPQFRVQAALQQQLVAAQTERTVDFLAVLLQRGDERPVGLVGFAVEVAELAA